MRRRNGLFPIVSFQEVEAGREYRGEWRGYKLIVHAATNVGTMWEGYINGGRVLRARTRANAINRLKDAVGQRYREEHL